VKEIQLILLISCSLFGLENPYRLDMDLSLFNQFNLGNYNTRLRSCGVVQAQGISLSLCYKLENNYILGFSGSSPMINHYANSQSWNLNNPSGGVGAFAQKDFASSAGVFRDFAFGLQCGYWVDGFESPDDASDPYYLTLFTTEYYGGPLLNLSLGFSNINITGKAAVNIGRRSAIHYNPGEHQPYASSWEPAASIDLSVGIRYSLYPGKGLPADYTFFELNHNAIFLELFGIGFLWSINYEYIAENHIAMRAGFSYVQVGDAPLCTAPVSLTYLVGEGNFRLEYGLGYAIKFISSSDDPGNVFPICGIRFQSDHRGLIWRIAYTPWIATKNISSNSDTRFLPWLSTSVGYSFPRIRNGSVRRQDEIPAP
jgi:hypothetical protein